MPYAKGNLNGKLLLAIVSCPVKTKLEDAIVEKGGFCLPMAQRLIYFYASQNCAVITQRKWLSPGNMEMFLDMNIWWVHSSQSLT